MAQLELEFVRELGSAASDAEGEALLLEVLRDGQLLEQLAAALWPAMRDLSAARAATASDLHDKFVHEGVGRDMQFGPLRIFHGGLEAMVGAPDPNVIEGMRREHCASLDSSRCFFSLNYKIRTTSETECTPDRTTSEPQWLPEGS